MINELLWMIMMIIIIYFHYLLPVSFIIDWLIVTIFHAFQIWLSCRCRWMNFSADDDRIQVMLPRLFRDFLLPFTPPSFTTTKPSPFFSRFACMPPLFHVSSRQLIYFHQRYWDDEMRIINTLIERKNIAFMNETNFIVTIWMEWNFSSPSTEGGFPSAGHAIYLMPL